MRDLLMQKVAGRAAVQRGHARSMWFRWILTKTGRQGMVNRLTEQVPESGYYVEVAEITPHLPIGSPTRDATAHLPRMQVRYPASQAVCRLHSELLEGTIAEVQRRAVARIVAGHFHNFQ